MLRHCVAFIKANFSVLLLVFAPRSSHLAKAIRRSWLNLRYHVIKNRPADADQFFMAGARGIEPRS